jgi:undecaprenyl-phosphate 4-deoxy-4-formamido-L-arabinose transferase
VVPLQLFSMAGMTVSLFSALFVLYLFLRRLIVGPEAEGVFTLFAIVFFLIGVALFGIGLLGEYVGRIYAQVRERPRYIVEAVLEEDDDGEIAQATPAMELSQRSQAAPR